jgi:hypothetical protein
MVKFYFNKNISYFIISHIIVCLFFAIIYNKLFDNIDTHFITNTKISNEEYLKHRHINALYLSVNMQTTTGFVDFSLRSSLVKIIASIQLFLSIFISLGVIYISVSQK